MTRDRDPLAELDLARFAREHWLAIVVGLVQSGRPEIARDFAAAAGIDLDQAEVELIRRTERLS